MILMNLCTIKMDKKRILKFNDAIQEAIEQSMNLDDSVIIIGEGVPDPKRVFGTTNNLLENFGDKRVFDMPISENALTGVCIGAAINGSRPIMTHQRVDFFLLALDQLINNAAKWSYMFDGKTKVPLVIRLIIGRGWGQGPQHSQNLQALFSHIPGLKVVMPSSAYEAKGLLNSSIKDNNPVIFIEHRWLYNTTSYVPQEYYELPLKSCNKINIGNKLTIVSTSYMTYELLNLIKIIENYENIDSICDILNVQVLNPFDDSEIIKSVEKTGKLLVIDSGHYNCGFAGEVISRVSEKCFDYLKKSPIRITLPDLPTPTSSGLTKFYYPNKIDILEKIHKLVCLNNYEKIKENLLMEFNSKKHDVPYNDFTGPF
jgi:pyruvate/2-oxoglutarate/acetoin dehydrogenase E1 component